MPPIRSARTRKPPPDGFEDIEDTLLEFSNKMKDAENASHDGKKKHESLWPIFQISHQRKSFDIHICPHGHFLFYSISLPLSNLFGYQAASLLSTQLFSLKADIFDLFTTLRRLAIYIRFILRERSYIKTVIRLAIKEQLRGCESNRQMEEARLWKGMTFSNSCPITISFSYSVLSFWQWQKKSPALLSPLHSNQRNKLQFNVYMSSSKSPAERRAEYTMR